MCTLDIYTRFNRRGAFNTSARLRPKRQAANMNKLNSAAWKWWHAINIQRWSANKEGIWDLVSRGLLLFSLFIQLFPARTRHKTYNKTLQIHFLQVDLHLKNLCRSANLGGKAASSNVIKSQKQATDSDVWKCAPCIHLSCVFMADLSFS